MDSSHGSRADEEACGKLWDMYVQEAQRYDEGLVRSWKEDMDVTLVFSGLYSAILTAFIIESYQNLQQDPADTSVVVLRQISSQISALSGTGNARLEPPVTFDPSSSALVCNILWFASLCLALLCAFLATFVQQWARKFLHRTTMGRSPSAQARLIQFLYFGLKDLSVHMVVEVIPSLLHLSIFLFFAGLLAFLVDVNIVLLYMIGVVLIVIAMLYVFFTILPIITLRSFYRTPLSPVIWRLWQSLPPPSALKRLGAIFPFKKMPASDPEEPAVGEAADHETPSALRSQSMKAHGSLQNAMLTACRAPNHNHEIHSITWTMKSINDDVELLQFVEALTDALWGPDGLRTRNHHLVRSLLETNDPHLNIILRVSSLLGNAENPWFNDNHQKRCSVVAPKFFWILASIFIRNPDTFTLPEISGIGARSIVWFSFDILERLKDYEDSLDRHYASSAIVLCALSRCETVHHALSASKTIRYGQLRPPAYDWALNYGHNPLSLIDTGKYDEVRSQLLAQSASAVSRYLQDASVAFPSQFDQTIACFWECRVKLYLNDDSALRKLIDQIEWYLPKNQHETPRGIPSLSELDRIFRVICSISPDEHASGVVQYITKRVDIGGWRATEIWNERVLTRFYDLISATDPADWNEGYFVALNEVITFEWVTAQELQFWDTLLQRYRRHIADSSTQVTSPLGSSLQLRIMAFFLHSHASHAFRANGLFLQHALAYTARNPQLHEFLQEHKEDAGELHFAFLFLIITDINLNKSPAQLRDVLIFYLRAGSSRPAHKHLVLPIIIKELSDHTKALAGDWIQEPSVERLEILYIVWSLWDAQLSLSEPPSKFRSEFATLSDAGQIVLTPESRSMIKQRGVSKLHEGLLKDLFGERDLPTLIEEVLSSLPNLSEA